MCARKNITHACVLKESRERKRGVNSKSGIGLGGFKEARLSALQGDLGVSRELKGLRRMQIFMEKIKMFSDESYNILCTHRFDGN